MPVPKIILKKPFELPKVNCPVAHFFMIATYTEKYKMELSNNFPNIIY